MKKLLTGLLAAVMFCGAGAAYAADAYPVYLGKDLLTRAYATNGTTFLPIRVVAENLGCKVDYQAASKRVVVTLDDGATLTLQLGSKKAQFNAFNKEEIELLAAPYAANNTAYVPLRLISERMGREVYWRAAEKSVVILPNYVNRISAGYDDWDMDWAVTADGQVYDCANGNFVVQAELLPGKVPSACDIAHTGRGNWLLTMEFAKEGEPGKYEHIWINGKTGEKTIIWADDYIQWPEKSVQVDGDSVWICTGADLHRIDDSTGNVVMKWALSAAIGEKDETLQLVEAAGGKALLLNASHSAWFLLGETANRAVNITDALLTDEVRAEVNEKLWMYVKEMPEAKKYATTEEFLATYWQDLSMRYDDDYIDRVRVCLDYQGVRDGVLYFELMLLTDEGSGTERYYRELTYALAGK